MTDEAITPDSAPAWRRWNIGRRAGEVALIALGVFLGLAGEHWRSNAERRAQARAPFGAFRAEIATNHESVAAVKDYRTEVYGPLFARPAPADKDILVLM
jgi:hypothetical protein